MDFPQNIVAATLLLNLHLFHLHIPAPEEALEPAVTPVKQTDMDIDSPPSIFSPIFSSPSPSENNGFKAVYINLNFPKRNLAHRT